MIETEIEPEPPKALDIKIGRIFDHKCELLSTLISMRLFRAALKTRFRERIDYKATKNLSRFTTQWADLVAAAIGSTQREAESRMDELIETIEQLTAASQPRVLEIQSDLERIRQAEAGFQD